MFHNVSNSLYCPVFVSDLYRKGKNKRESHLCNSLIFSCTPAGARTLDTLIKSQVLYQLSYGCILKQFLCF